jgi:hypothetical protein
LFGLPPLGAERVDVARSLPCRPRCDRPQVLRA